jgi:hypothetical protein
MYLEELVLLKYIFWIFALSRQLLLSLGKPVVMPKAQGLTEVCNVKIVQYKCTQSKPARILT